MLGRLLGHAHCFDTGAVVAPVTRILLRKAYDMISRGCVGDAEERPHQPEALKMKRGF